MRPKKKDELIAVLRREYKIRLKPFETELGIAGIKSYQKFLSRLSKNYSDKALLAIIKRREQEENERLLRIEKCPCAAGIYLADIGKHLGLEGFIKLDEADFYIAEIKKYSSVLIEECEKLKTPR